MRTRDSIRGQSWTACSASGPRRPAGARLADKAPPAAVSPCLMPPMVGDAPVVVADGQEIDPVDQPHRGEASRRALESSRAAGDGHLFDEHREVSVGADGGGLPGEGADDHVAVGRRQQVGTRGARRGEVNDVRDLQVEDPDLAALARCAHDQHRGRGAGDRRDRVVPLEHAVERHLVLRGGGAGDRQGGQGGQDEARCVTVKSHSLSPRGLR
jgi:hypothetical protein